MSSNSSGRNAAATEAGGRDVVEDAFARYQSELMGMLYYLVGNTEDARDAYQEAFVKCWRHRQSVGEIANLKAWVFRVAMNAGRDLRNAAWRRRRKPLPEDESVLMAREEHLDTALTEREQLALVRRLLLDLRQEEQEVFLLRQNGQMTYEEIAREINVPVGTVKTRMRMALAQLRQSIGLGQAAKAPLHGTENP